MHIPVLLNEVVENLNLSDSKKVLDCTLGGGGHTLEILRQYPEIAILGIEWDPMLARDFKEKHGDKITIVNDSYVNLKNICREHNFQPDAILFDLGLSSWHYEESGRGFSFRKDEMLDMRFNPERGGLTAAQIINTYDSRELERILREYGEEDSGRQDGQLRERSDDRSEWVADVERPCHPCASQSIRGRGWCLRRGELGWIP